jgi:hypothetical protein
LRDTRSRALFLAKDNSASGLLRKQEQVKEHENLVEDFREFKSSYASGLRKFEAFAAIDPKRDAISGEIVETPEKVEIDVLLRAVKRLGRVLLQAGKITDRPVLWKEGDVLQVVDCKYIDATADAVLKRVSAVIETRSRL